MVVINSSVSQLASHASRTDKARQLFHFPPRRWKAGDQIALDLDLTPHIWPGEKECASKGSIYRGPILLAVNLPDKTPLPVLNAQHISPAKLQPPGQGWLTVRIASERGPIDLIDYASAGAGGVRYATWLPMKDAQSVTFSKSHPLPTVRVAGQK